MNERKPILHARDHMPGGADPLSIGGSAMDWPAGAWRPGHWLSTAFVNADVAATVTSLEAMPLWVPREALVDRIGVFVTTANAGTHARLGIYADSGLGFPGMLLVDAGLIDGSSTGPKDIAINQMLTEDLFWLACMGDLGPIHLHGQTGNVGLVTGATITESLQGDAGGAYRENVSETGELPDPFGSMGAVSVSSFASHPRVLVRAGS